MLQFAATVDEIQVVVIRGCNNTTVQVVFDWCADPVLFLPAVSRAAYPTCV